MKTFYAILDIPSPYRIHLLTEMWRQVESRGIEFHVHFMSDFSKGNEDRPKSWHNPKMDFPYTYWNDYGHGHHHFNPGMLCYLRKMRPDYVLIGCPFDTFTSICVPFVLRHSKRCTWTEGNTKTTGQMGGFKGWFKRFIFSKYPYVAVPGIQGKMYIELHQQRTSRKMPECIYLPNLVDETRFKPRACWQPAKIKQIRAQLGVDEQTRLCLIPARLEWYKGLLEFIDHLPPANKLKNWRIVIMGQGSLQNQIQQRAAQLALGKIITILPYVPYAEMPQYYAAADLFLLPSLHDHNPLTVIEALHSGLPVAVSNMAGNVDEAVTDGVNGWVLPVKESATFKDMLSNVFDSNLEQLKTMGNMSKFNAQFWNTQKSVMSFLDQLIR